MDDSHDFYLEELINNLNEIDEDKKKIKYIIKDGIWLRENSFERISLPDLIIIYYNHNGKPIELKGSKSKRAKAISQLKYGKIFIMTELLHYVEYGKIVYYHAGSYEYESVPLMGRVN